MRNPGTNMQVRLSGTNRIRKFRQIAEKLAAQITRHHKVNGIVFIGGLARGFADRSSDLDVMVFIDQENGTLEKQIRQIVANESKKTNIEIDLEIRLLDNFKKHKWNEIEKWDFSHAEISYDQNGQIRKIIDAKSKTSKEFWLRRLVQCAEYMKWYCCPSSENVGTVAETWIDRGDPVSAHFCLSYAIELILKTVFALNKEAMPPPKWSVFYSRSLKWLPKNYALLNDVMKTGDLSVADLRLRLEAVRKIWAEILLKIRSETGFGPREIDRYYVEQILNQQVTD
jgi:predicted nucleotidyltransferase